MVNFLQNNKKYNLTVLSDRIVGEVGFSFHSESFNLLLNCISNYGSQEQIQNIIICYDSRLVAKDFAEIAAYKLTYLGFKVSIIERPCTYSEAAWLSAQQASLNLCIYLTSDFFIDSKLSVMFINNQGPIVDKNLIAILKASTTIKTKELAALIVNPEPTHINIDGYAIYLKDSNIQLFNTSRAVNIDCMFGASEYLLKLLKELYSIQLNLYNLHSAPPRLTGYYPKPTGDKLKWYTKFASVQEDQYFFALDGNGDRIGIYDLKQNIEISTSSTALLLLYALRTTNNKTLLITPNYPTKITKYAKKLGYIVKIVDNIFKHEFKKATLALTEQENFIIDGRIDLPNALIVASLVISICEESKKSPGELVDNIIKELKTKETVNKLLFSTQYITLDSLIKVLEQQSFKRTTLKSKSICVLKNKTSKIVLKECKIEGIIEATIESKQKDICDTLTKDLLNYANTQPITST